MSFTKNSRPASGSEHIISHLIECTQLRDGIIPNYHGEDIGVCTLEMLKYYNELADHESIKAHKEQVNWQEILDFYGDMQDDVKALNIPTTITDDVNPAELEAKWPEIRKIIRSVPSYEVCREAMVKAGCKITVEDIGKPQKLFDDCVKYSPYMRRRLTLLRLRDMIEV
jgi:glycerol-1-phosphate dehydrogenase [NAD(P)+]